MMVTILILTIAILSVELKWRFERHMSRIYRIREIEKLISHEYAEYEGDEEDQPGLKELREELKELKK